MFCKKCGKLMTYEESRLICSGCGHSEKGEELIIKDRKKIIKKIEIVTEEDNINPIIGKECTKCKNNKAYTWALQTRSADEPETIFYKCTKCKHLWRE